ncbi:MAG TPA: CHAT domain-containing protein [Pyrinomonadaceae bacterium]|nr:CHAT domain-containing protein [Pyrinomonadaceae bacterium]
MSQVARLRFLFPLLLLVVAASISGQYKTASVAPGQEPSQDEVLLRALVTRYFDYFAKKDLDDLLKQWSAKAPGLEVRRKELQQAFAANDRVDVGYLLIRDFTIDGDRAAARVALEISATDVKTSQPSAAFGRMNRAMRFVKESGGWKIWHEASAEEEFAVVLVGAKKDQERAALLVQEHELVNPQLISALKLLGDRASDYREELRIYSLGESLAEKIGDKHSTAEMLNGVGALHRMLADYPRAIDAIHRSLAISEQIGDQAAIARSFLGLGVLSSARGSFTVALEYYQKSLSLSKSLGDKKGIALALSGIAQAAELLGDYAQALDSYNKSLALRSELGDKISVALGLNAIGAVYYRQGNYSQALEYSRRSLAMSEEGKSKQGSAQALSTIASVYREQGEYTQALDHYQQSLSIREGLGERKGVGTQLNNIGVVYYLQGRYAQALEYFAKALWLREAIGDKLGIAQSFNSIAHVHHDSGDYAKAIEFAERAASLARDIGNRETLWNARTVAGKSYRALNRFTPAREAYAEAIATIEALRFQVAGGEKEQEQFFENKVAPYHAMAELLVAQNNASEALNYAERARARVLLDVLRNGRTNPSKAMNAGEGRREHELRDELASLNTQVTREKLRLEPDRTRLSDLEARLENARLEHEDFEAALYSAHPELKTLRGETAPLRIEQASELLPDEKIALLEYAVSGDQVYLFVLTRSGGTPSVDLKAYTLPVKRNDLTARVEKFRQRLANHDLEYADSAAELYDLLIKPAATQLRNKRTLVIVPDDILWDLPFQALAPAPGHYLIKDYSVSYAPSLTVLREMIARRGKHARSGQSELLAVGNPALGKQTMQLAHTVFANEQLDPLPEAERQVKTLARLYGPERSKVYIGTEAREDRVKSEAAKYRILQLAAHSVLNNANPMYSHIVLSQSGDNSKEDGLLEAWEVMNLDLNADLVVLSACDTARGRIGAGEGVIGLSWAFFVAGCPTTVVSLWSVESASTTELMLQFHRNLKPLTNGPSPISKAEALRLAQMKLLRDKRYQHPFFWAGFVVIGDGF